MTQQYDVIAADPPWKYGNRCTHSKTKFGGGVHAHYPTMTDKEIKALGPKIQRISAPNSALFLWVTGAKLDVGIEVLKAWGFRYATIGFCWVKLNGNAGKIAKKLLFLAWLAKAFFKGPGFYTASNVELVLIGAKGSMTPKRKGLSQLIVEPHPRWPKGTPPAPVFNPKTGLWELKKREGKIIHSRKPDTVYERIELMYPEARKLELFARTPREGWDVIGNQLENGQDVREALA